MPDHPPRLPLAMLRFSRLPIALLRLGIPLGPLRLLETRGRRSGQWRTVPVVVYHDGGRRYLVSVFGETGWVANIRASGSGRLRRGRGAEEIQVVEVLDQRRDEVSMHLRRDFGIVPFVRQAFTARPDDGIEAFRAEAHRHPTFLLRD